MVSDAYDIKEIDGAVFEVDCQMIQVKQGGDVDIGANPSAEEGDDALEDGVETVNNLVYSFRLQSTSFDKKMYLTYIKVCRDELLLIFSLLSNEYTDWVYFLGIHEGC